MSGHIGHPCPPPCSADCTKQTSGARNLNRFVFNCLGAADKYPLPDGHLSGRDEPDEIPSPYGGGLSVSAKHQGDDRFASRLAGRCDVAQVVGVDQRVAPARLRAV